MAVNRKSSGNNPVDEFMAKYGSGADGRQNQLDNTDQLGRTVEDSTNQQAIASQVGRYSGASSATNEFIARYGSGLAQSQSSGAYGAAREESPRSGGPYLPIETVYTKTGRAFGIASLEDNFGNTAIQAETPEAMLGIRKAEEEEAQKRYDEAYDKATGGRAVRIANTFSALTPAGVSTALAGKNAAKGADAQNTQELYDAALQLQQAKSRSAEEEGRYWSEKEKTDDFKSAVESGKKLFEQRDGKFTEYTNQAIAQLMSVAELPLNHRLGAGFLARGLRDVVEVRSKQPQDRWTDEERNRFYYYYAKDKDQAAQYAESINSKYDNEHVEEQKEFFRNVGEKVHPLGFVSGVLNGGQNTFDYAAHLADYAASGGKGGKSRGQITLAGVLNALSEGSATDLNEKHSVDIPGIGRIGAGDAFQLTQSIAKSMMNALVGQSLGLPADATSFMMFGDAANMTCENVLARGGTEGQALLMGGAAGLVEAATEKYSIEALMGDPTKYGAYILKQIFTEGSEEVASDLLNTTIDELVMDHKSEYNLNVNKYVSEGLSLPEAQKQAYKDWLVGLGLDFLGGALSGGVSAGAMSAGANITNRPARGSNRSDAPTLQDQTTGNNTNFVNAPVNVLGGLTLDTPYTPNEHSLVDLLSEVQTEQQLEKALDKIEDSPELAEAFYDLSGMEVDEYREKYQNDALANMGLDNAQSFTYPNMDYDTIADWQKRSMRQGPGNRLGVDNLLNTKEETPGEETYEVVGANKNGPIYAERENDNRSAQPNKPNQYSQPNDTSFYNGVTNPLADEAINAARRRQQEYARQENARRSSLSDEEKSRGNYEGLLRTAKAQVEEDYRNVGRIANGQNEWASVSPRFRADILSEITGEDYYVRGDEVVRSITTDDAKEDIKRTRADEKEQLEILGIKTERHVTTNRKETEVAPNAGKVNGQQLTEEESKERLRDLARAKRERAEKQFPAPIRSEKYGPANKDIHLAGLRAIMADEAKLENYINGTGDYGPKGKHGMVAAATRFHNLQMMFPEANWNFDHNTKRIWVGEGRKVKSTPTQQKGAQGNEKNAATDTGRGTEDNARSRQAYAGATAREIREKPTLGISVPPGLGSRFSRDAEADGRTGEIRNALRQHGFTLVSEEKAPADVRDAINAVKQNTPGLKITLFDSSSVDKNASTKYQRGVLNYGPVFYDGSNGADMLVDVATISDVAKAEGTEIVNALLHDSAHFYFDKLGLSSSEALEGILSVFSDRKSAEYWLQQACDKETKKRPHIENSKMSDADKANMYWQEVLCDVFGAVDRDFKLPSGFANPVFYDLVKATREFVSNYGASSQEAAGAQQNAGNTETAEQPAESRTEAPAELNSQQKTDTQPKPVNRVKDKVPASIRALLNEYQSDEAARNKAAEERGGIDVEAEDFDVEDNSPRQQESELPRRETTQKVMPKSESERIQQREDARRAEEEEYMREYHPEEYERNQEMQRREDQRAKDEAEYKGEQSNPAEPESSREYRSKPQREARKAADKAAANEEAQRNAERDHEQEEAEYKEAQAKEREAQQKEAFGEEVYEKLKKLSRKLGDRLGTEHVASTSPGTYKTKSGETKRSGVSDVYQVFSPNPGGYYVEPFVRAAQGLVTGESSMADVARAYHELSLDETKGSYFYDKSIDKALRKLNDSLNGQKISPDVADRIVKVLQMADHRIGRMQAMLKSRPDIAKAFDAQNLTPKEKKSLRKALEWAKREQLRPDVAFEMLGGHDSKNGAFFYSLSKQVKDSVKNFTNIFQTANDYVQPLTQRKDFGKFASGKITVKNVIPGLRNENYGSTISANMAVSFLKTLETNGAIEHIINKGIVEMPRSEKEYNGGGNNKGFGNGQSGYSFMFDPISQSTRQELEEARGVEEHRAAEAKAKAELQQVIRDLHSEIDKVPVAKLAYDISKKPIRYLARAANKTARVLYGVDIATQGDNYWSMFAGGEHTAGELLNGDVFGMNEQRNMQERTGDSGGLRIMSFTDTLDMIMQTEAHWAAFQELSDTLDILSREFTDKDHVKDSLTDQIMHNGFGKEWVEWLQNYENDINGIAREGDQFASAFIGKLRSNIAQSSLTFNPSVALKQTPSGLNYMSVIDPDIVAKRFFTGKFKIMRSYMNDALIQTVEKHTRVLASRRSGLDVMGIDTENASQRKGLIGKISSFLSKPGSTWITRQDVKTVANGMLACADQVDRWIKNQKPGYENLKKGSYEYYEAIADLFEEATIRTQPIYNREFRAEQFRTNNEIIRSLSMFRTQPSQNYNNMVQALGELNAAKRRGDAEAIKNARKRLAAASTGLVTSAISFAVLDTVMKLALRKWKQYRDKDGELDEGVIGAKTAYTFLNTLFSTSWPASLISPFAIDATTGLLNKANGNIPKSGLWNGTQESGLSLVNDFQESLKSFTENPTLKTGKALVLSTASMTGVPARNWYNMLNAAFLWGIDAIPATRGANYNNEDDVLNAIYAYCSAKPNSRGKQAMRMALNMAREGNPDAKEYILSTLDWSNEELVKGAKAELTEQFKLGQIGEARYRDILERYFKEDDDAVDKLVNAGNSAKEYNAAVERAKAKNSSYDQVSANLDKLNSDSDPTGEERFKMISGLDLDDKDTDTFISHHMSSGYTKNYFALRESGFSPDRANQILQEIDTDTGGDQKFGISQAEVYAYSLTSPGNARTAKELWAARVSSGDWVKSFDKYEESYKKDPVNILMGYGMSEGSAKSVMQDMNTDGKGVTQAEFYAYYKTHPAQQEALRAVWATKWPKSDFNAYAKKHG